MLKYHEVWRKHVNNAYLESFAQLHVYLLYLGMRYLPVECKNCKESIPFDTDRNETVCPYCHTAYTLIEKEKVIIKIDTDKPIRSPELARDILYKRLLLIIPISAAVVFLMLSIFTLVLYLNKSYLEKDSPPIFLEQEIGDYVTTGKLYMIEGVRTDTYITANQTSKSVTWTLWQNGETYKFRLFGNFDDSLGKDIFKNTLEAHVAFGGMLDVRLGEPPIYVTYPWGVLITALTLVAGLVFTIMLHRGYKKNKAELYKASEKIELVATGKKPPKEKAYESNVEKIEKTEPETNVVKIETEKANNPDMINIF